MTTNESSITPEGNTHIFRNRLLATTMLGLTAAGAIGLQPDAAAAYEVNQNGTITVEQGDALSTIIASETGEKGAELYATTEQVAKENHIKDANIIHPGDKITLKNRTPKDEHHVLTYGQTIWGETKQHYGYVTPELVHTVSAASHLDEKHYLAGSVLTFPKVAAKQETNVKPNHDAKIESHWTIKDKHQTIWALSALVAAATGTTHGEAMAQVMAANPGVEPKQLQNGDIVKLPGVSDAKIAQILDGISHLKYLEETVKKPAPAATEIKKSTFAGSAAHKSHDKKTLTTELLQSPNITIQNSPNNRVEKSINDIADDGKTFTHDVNSDNNGEVDVSTRLLQTTLALAEDHKIEITSLTTGKHSTDSDHYHGEAIDYAINEDSPDVFKALYENRDEIGVDELIWGETLPEGTCNLNDGQPYEYSQETLAAHAGNRKHIHVSFKSAEALPVGPVKPTPELDTAIVESSVPYQLSPEQLAQIDSLDIADSKKQFLKSAIIGAEEVAKKHHINPSVMIAQAIVESSWGEHTTGDYNYFGIKGGDVANGTGALSSTFEYDANGRYDTKAVFRSYASPEAAFNDYAEMIGRLPWYKDAIENYQDWRAYLNGLQNGPPNYATAPDYVEVVGGIVEQYKIDTLAPA